jgi:lysophospholipase L1-like esterase
VYEWYEDEVRGVEKRAKSATQHPVTFYGSSSVRLWTTLAEDFAGVPVLNLGFGGSTLAACAYYFERLALPPAPRSLIVYAGDNDIGDGQSPAAVIASLDDLAAKIDRALPGIPVGYISIKPSPARWELVERIRTVNAAAKALFSSRTDRVYLDVFSAMLSDTGGPRPELFDADGLHMNREGYRLWWQVIGAERNRLLL